MKKYYFLLVVCVALIVSSCSDDEAVYSCDKDLDAWVRSNIVKIQSMKIEEWKSLPPSKKRASYGAFTKAQRVNCWKRKFDDVLSLKWSQDERKHILLARNFVMTHQDFFTGKSLSDEQQNVVDLFCYDWSDVAMKKFGWSKETVIAIIASLEDMGSDKVLVRSRSKDGTFNPNINNGDKGGNDCNCNIKYDFCGLGNMCENSDCTTVPYCGWLLLSDCNGKCLYY